MPEGVLQTYRERLPVTPKTPMITMGEGNTPLVKSQRLGPQLGLDRLYFKLEGCNPTGSFKDRGMVMAVAHALEEGSRTILCASTGNTSASAAAYGAACGLTTVVLVPKGNVAQGKLAQAMAYGAHIIVVDGNFDQALELAYGLSQRRSLALVNSVNPYRLEGQKTAAFEICDVLGEAPHAVCIPVGNAGNITAYWQGFREYFKAKLIASLPKMWGFQAAGAAPIVLGEPVAAPQTIASAIRIGNPASWQPAVTARNESGGAIESVTDEEILEAYRTMARMEGIFCEPASAAAVAGLMKRIRQSKGPGDGAVVCVITGTGLKDPELAQRTTDAELMEVAPAPEAVEEAIASLSLG